MMDPLHAGNKAMENLFETEKQYEPSTTKKDDSPKNQIVKTVTSQKCQHCLKNSQEDNLLINFDDDAKTTNYAEARRFERAQDLPLGSLGSVKAEFDLIDLFENIFVTPQQLRSNKCETSALGVLKYNEDATNFLEEPGEHFEVNAYKPCSSSERFESSKFEKMIYTTDAVRKEVHGLENYSMNTERRGHFDAGLESEEINDLAVKSFQNCKLTHSNSLTTEVPDEYFENSELEDPDDDIDALFYASSVKLQPKPMTQNTNANKIMGDNPILKIEPSSFLCDNLGKHSARSDGNTQKLQIIKKTDMAFTKIKRNLNKNPNKRTKGPSYEEKCRDLPPILERLAERKLLLKEHRKLKKYDPMCAEKSKSTNKQKEFSKKKKSKMIYKDTKKVDFNPVTIMADCNKERLKDLRIRQNFEKFVTEGNFS